MIDVVLVFVVVIVDAVIVVVIVDPSNLPLKCCQNLVSDS